MIRFGMIGTGRIAESFFEANRYGYPKGMEITAIYSRTKERAEAFIRRKGNWATYDDFDAFAQSDTFDAAYIASPNYCHYEQAVKLMRAGKHVLCEKPIASNYREAEKMFEVAKENGVILLEGMCSLYTPTFAKMQGYLHLLGTMRRATFQYCKYSSRYDNYKRGIIENAFKPELSNGALMDIGVYPISCMVRLFGMPKSIKAMGIKLSNGIDGEGSILMEYDSMMGEVIYSKITNSILPSQIQGESASMAIREIQNIKDLEIIGRGTKQIIRFEQSDNILGYETEAFVKMIQTGTGWEESMQVSLNVMKIIDEARKQIGIVFPADEREIR